MKFKLHALEFEIEGQQDVVRDEFKNFNENILTHILSKVNIVQSETGYVKPVTPTGQLLQISDPITQNNNLNDDRDYPVLRDVKLRDLPKTETEWLLIYAFYSSQFSTREFAKENLIKLYEETDRKTENRIANLSNNLKSIVSSLYIKSTNNTNFILLPKGVAKAREILSGNSSTEATRRSKKNISKINTSAKNNVKKHYETVSEISKSVNKKSKNSNSVSYSFVSDLNLHPKNGESLKGFFSQYKTASTVEVVLIIIYYLEKILKQSNIDGNSIYTCYKNLGLPVPSIRDALGNIHIRKGWVNTSNRSDLKLTISGENYIEHEMEKK